MRRPSLQCRDVATVSLLDVVFCAYNRLEFTQRTFCFLTENTDWVRVDRLVVYDDGSQPKSRRWLREACEEFDLCAVEFRAQERRWGSPVGVMMDYLKRDPAEWFVKLDNDIAMPFEWLNDLLDVRQEHPEADLIGMEAGMTRVRGQDGSDPDEPVSFEPATHIGGIGLMRTEAFLGARTKLRSHGQWYGFTEWQHRNPDVVRGWITPDLRCPLLDRLPFTPFLDLSARYRQCGWQRHWGTYDPVWMAWSFDWVMEAETATKGG